MLGLSIGVIFLKDGIVWWFGDKGAQKAKLIQGEEKKNLFLCKGTDLVTSSWSYCISSLFEGYWVFQHGLFWYLRVVSVFCFFSPEVLRLVQASEFLLALDWFFSSFKNIVLCKVANSILSIQNLFWQSC